MIMPVTGLRCLRQ